MATENVRLGVDSRPAVAGFQRYENAAAKAIGKTWSLNAVVGTLAGSFGALAAGRAIGTAIRGMVEFDSAMTQSLSIMGNVDSMMRDRMASAAREVGEALNFGAEQGAEAFFFLASAGLDAELPLDRNSEIAAYRRSLLSLDRSKRQVTDARDGIVAALRSDWRNLQSAEQNYRIQRMSVDLAQRRIESLRLLFEAGRVVMRDVLEAQDALIETQNALTVALVNHRLTWLRLLHDLERLPTEPETLWSPALELPAPHG